MSNSTLCVLSICMCILHIVFCTVCKYVLSICKLFLHCLEHALKNLTHQGTDISVPPLRLWVVRKRNWTPKRKKKEEMNWPLFLPFLLTSSSRRLMRFAMPGGSTVRSLSGRLNRYSNWQLNSCCKEQEIETFGKHSWTCWWDQTPLLISDEQILQWFSSA